MDHVDKHMAKPRILEKALDSVRSFRMLVEQLVFLHSIMQFNSYFHFQPMFVFCFFV